MRLRFFKSPIERQVLLSLSAVDMKRTIFVSLFILTIMFSSSRDLTARTDDSKSADELASESVAKKEVKRINRSKQSFRWGVSTNAVDYANLGTLNIEGSASVARHITINLSARYNPWTFHKGDPRSQMQNRHQTYAIGMRYWPWNVYSGFWFGGKFQYQEYNRGGIISRKGPYPRLTEEGDAFGLGIAAGYSLMIHSNINLDFGFGGWGGKKAYVNYACPHCGRIVESGSKWFFLPNELLVSVTFLF